MTDETHGTPRTVGHEQRDVRFWPIVMAASGLLVVTTIIFALMRGLFVFYDDRQARQSPPPNPLAVEYGEPLPPQPRLQTDPVQDLLKFRTSEETVLQSYGWVDPQAGIVRIPIQRAMELLAQNPPPARAVAEDIR
jgi:hypothetical protein